MDVLSANVQTILALQHNITKICTTKLSWPTTTKNRNINKEKKETLFGLLMHNDSVLTYTSSVPFHITSWTGGWGPRSVGRYSDGSSYTTGSKGICKGKIKWSRQVINWQSYFSMEVRKALFYLSVPTLRVEQTKEKVRKWRNKYLFQDDR